MDHSPRQQVVYTRGGVGFMGLLTILFIYLKLTDQIDWSWVWVVSPLWLGIVVGIAAWLVIVVIAGLCALVLKLLQR